MRSVGLGFNIPLFKKQVKRFWPLWSLYSFGLLLFMPVYLLFTARGFLSAREIMQHYREYLLSIIADYLPFVALIFGLLVAMAVWSYFYNSRAVSMIHSLPLSRGTIFLTNYLAGISFFLIPNAVIFLLSIGVEAGNGALDMQSLGLWFLALTLMCFFFYSFATLVAFVTGHILALPALYFIFNGLALALMTQLQMFFSEFLFGFAYGSIESVNWIGRWLTPVFAMLRGRAYLTYQVAGNGNLLAEGMIRTERLSVILIYAAVGLLMAVAAYLLYRRRKLETAGEVVTEAFLRPVFKYGTAICGSLGLGTFSYTMLSSVLPQGVILALLCFIVWGVICYFAAEMLLKKSFRVIREGMRGCVVLVCLVVVFVVGAKWDPFGYGRTLPQLDDVTSVQMIGSSMGSDYRMDVEGETDSAQMEKIIAFHENVIQNKKEIETVTEGKEPAFLIAEESYSEDLGLSLATTRTEYVSITYTMKNGKEIAREYRIPISKDLLEEETSPANQLDALVNQPEWILHGVFPKGAQEETLLQIRIDSFETTEGDGAYGNSWTQGNKMLSGEEARLLCEAVQKDIQGGRLGRTYLLQNEAFLRSTYVNQLHFTFWKAGGLTEQRTEIEQGYLSHLTEDPYIETSVSLAPTANETLRVLKELGLADSIRLMTPFDQMKAEVHGEGWQWKEIEMESIY